MAASTGPVNVVKQFVANFERKQRNLIKRKGKLDTYRDQLNRGEPLNEEQKKAVDGYEGVIQSLNVVQEVLTQSKDLINEVEECCKATERQKEIEHEKYTVSFLHTHICLMRLLEALNHYEVRAAIIKASSENNLKVLDAVRHILIPPLPESLSSSNSSFLEASTEVDLAAQHSMNLVLGRPVPIPVPNNYDGPHKKLNFKEARNICLRLLANPSVRGSLQFPMQSVPVLSLQEETVSHTKESMRSPGESFHHNSANVHVDGFPLHADEVAPEPSQSSNRRCDPPSAPNMLDQVIKPLGGTFNFLQASSVMTSNPINESPVPCIGIPTGHQAESKIGNTTEELVHVTNNCYTQSSHSTHETLYTGEPENEIPVPIETISQAADGLQHVQQSQVSVEPDAPTKPISYADLVRRSGLARIQPQQEPCSSGSAAEPRKVEHVSESHHVHDSGDGDYGHHGPSWNRGGRGFGRGFFRGPRRAVGGARYNRLSAGAGRGGGGPFRGAPPSVAQPSY